MGRPRLVLLMPVLTPRSIPPTLSGRVTVSSPGPTMAGFQTIASRDLGRRARTTYITPLILGRRSRSPSLGPSTLGEGEERSQSSRPGNEASVLWVMVRGSLRG